MITRLLFLLLPLLGFFFAVNARAASALPLRDGEHFTFRVAWAVLPGAGEIKIDAAAAGDRLTVTTATTTRGFAKMLMPFQAKAESVFDLRTGRALTMSENADARGKKTDHRVAFDYTKREATYTPILPAGTARALPIPAGDPTDLIVALLQTRTWDLKPGENRDALVLFDDDFYELTIHATRYENVRTGLGTFRTLVLEPRMDKTAPKGMFKRGSTVRVWISQDEKRLPVKFEVEFKVGTGTATLEKHTPPPGAPAATVPASGASSSSTAPAASTDAKNPRP
jgi:hypothetical protein